MNDAQFEQFVYCLQRLTEATESMARALEALNERERQKTL